MSKLASAEYNKTITGSLMQAVFQTICYFDIFNFPLTRNEIRKYCPQEIDKTELEDILTELTVLKKIKQAESFYFLADKSESIITRRAQQEKYLRSKMNKIKRYAKLVSKFPFVEAVFISGSVSKGVLSKQGDVDYFIVAKSRRVWLCRTLLILYKKIFLLNSKKYFCVNYFIDEENLRVPDNNLFVATEIKTLLPVTDNLVSQRFFSANEWAATMFPNADEQRNTLFTKDPVKTFGKLVERMCSGRIGEKLDNYFFRMTLNQWRKKFPHFNESQFDLNMRSYKNVSKHHPQGNQVRILNELALRMNRL